MARQQSSGLKYQRIELEGVSYAILRESQLKAILRRAGLADPGPGDAPPEPPAAPRMDTWDPIALARSLVSRRERAGITQADLARRAGVRVETLNRIERRKTTPDFATLRKLAVALRKAESRLPV